MRDFRRSGPRMAVLAATAVGVLGLAACGGSDSSSTGTASSTAAAGSDTGASTAASGGGKKADIAAFIVDSANPYDTSLSKAMQAEAAKEGASIQVFSADNDPQKQVGQCDDALATQKFNVFVVKAVAGPTLMNCARQAIAKGIKVIAIDDPLGPEYTTKPQVDGVSASVLSLPTTNGTALAEMTKEACGDASPCKAAYYYGPPAFVFASQSRQSFLDNAKKDGIDVVDQGSSNFDLATAYTLTKSLLAKEPDVNVITADSDQSASGSIKALKEAGKLDQVKVVGGGGSGVGATSIKAGDQFGTSALYPASLGTKGIELGVKALNGEDLGKTEYDVAYLSPLGPKITKANVDKFKPEW